MDTKLSIVALCLLATLRAYTAPELTFSRSGRNANQIELGCLVGRSQVPAASPTFYTIIPGSSSRLRVDSTTVQNYSQRDDGHQVVFTLTPETEAEFSCESQGDESSSVLLAAFRPTTDEMQSQIQHVYTGETAELECVIRPGRAKELYNIEWHRYSHEGSLIPPPIIPAILPDGPNRYISPSNFSLFVAVDRNLQNGTGCECTVAITSCSPASHPYCDPTSPRFVDGRRITLIVEDTEQQPEQFAPPTRSSTLTPENNSQSPTMPPPTTNPPGDTTSSPPGDTRSTPPTEALDVMYIITVCVPAGLGVIVIIALLLCAGCVTVCCIMRQRGKKHCEIEKLRRRIHKLEKDIDKMQNHLSKNPVRKTQQKELIAGKRQEIDNLRVQVRTQKDDNDRRANELREEARRMETEVTDILKSNHKIGKQEKALIKAKNKEIRSLRKQASVLTDAGEDDVDGDVKEVEDDENVFDATCRSTTNPHAHGRTNHETIGDSIYIEISEEVLFKESYF